MPTLTKKAIRKIHRANRAKFSELEQQNHADAVKNQLVEAQLALHTKTVAAYLASDGELDLQQAITYLHFHAVKVLVPKVAGKAMNFVQLKRNTDLVENTFGINEPVSDITVSIGDKDVVLVPGVAFTPSGDRLGRGGGYYDDYLSTHRSLVNIGVAHECQMVQSLPTDENDIKLDAVVTEKGWRYVSRRASQYLNLTRTDDN